MTEALTVGDVLIGTINSQELVVIQIRDDLCYLCDRNLKYLKIIVAPVSSIVRKITSLEFSKTHIEQKVINIDDYDDKSKTKYFELKSFVNEVYKLYENNLTLLSSRKQKPEFEALLLKYNYSSRHARYWLCRYFQSGMQNYSLVDQRVVGTNIGKSYESAKKLGRPPKYGIAGGLAKDEEMLEHFNEALEQFKSGRFQTIKSAFTNMNVKYYSEIIVKDGTANIILKPESERPTIRQFRYFVEKNLSKEQLDTIKTSAAEVRNNKRLRLSDSLKDVLGPGDMVEIDAMEADISLVSELDNNQTVGRPIVYFMIDVYSKAIIAMSVSFDNNSVIALTNLLLNLNDDKAKYCEKYGITLKNPKLWHSNIIPRRLRVDRGSDFKSKEFERICIELGIEKQIVTGAMGSLKGTVEQSFRQLNVVSNVHFEKKGLIEKRHDSNHHKEARLTIYQFTQIVINFVLYHNQRSIKGYPLTKDMITKNIEPVPAILYEYGIKYINKPRSIKNSDEFIFTLLTPAKAKITNSGIKYNGLYYLPDNDEELYNQMYLVGSKSETFNIRIDKRNVGYVYYLRNNTLIVARLNTNKTGNTDYENMTWKEYEDYKSAKLLIKHQGEIKNETIEANLYAANQSVVKTARKKNPNHKNIREHRNYQKQKTEKEYSAINQLNYAEKEEFAEEISTANVKTKNFTVDQYKDMTWKEALDEFFRK